MRLCVVIAAGAIALSGTSRASPLEDSTLGGAVFTGPTHGHASAMFINPAALGLTGRGWHLHLGGSMRLSSLWLDRKTIAVSGAVEDGPSTSTHTLSPGALAAFYFSVRENTGHFGLSVYAPNWERFPGREPELGYHSRGGHFFQGMFTAAGSYRFAGRIIVGISFSLGYSRLRYRFARDSALDGGSDDETGIRSDCGGEVCGHENPEAREFYDVAVSSGGIFSGFFAVKNIALSSGIALRVKDDIWVALSYSGLPGAFAELDVRGDATVDTAPRDGGERLSGEAEVTFRTPHAVWAGVRAPTLPGYELIAGGRWQDLSRHRLYDLRLFGGEFQNSQTEEWIPRYRGLRDVWRIFVGLEGDESQSVRLGARLRAETGAVTDQTITPQNPAGLNFTGAVGLELRLAEQFILGAGFETTWFPEVDSTRSQFDPRDRIACVDSQFDFNQCEAARAGRDQPTPLGRYNRLQQGMVLSLRYDSL